METSEQTRTANRHHYRLDLHVGAEQRRILDQAAAATGTSVGAFVLNRAIDAARDVVADCSGVALPEERWNNFLALLDRDPPPGSNLLANALPTRRRQSLHGSLPAVDADAVAGPKAHRGVVATDHGWDSQLASNDGRVRERRADAGDDCRRSRE
jgi:uncharacterized protein (DUF1778 family)